MFRRLRKSALFWQPLARLAPGRTARLRFWLVTLELTVRHKLRRPPATPRRLDVVANAVPVSFLVGGIEEVHGLREVLVQGDYELPQPSDPAVIVDLGGNIGASAVYFATRYPTARVVVLEPDPDSFERLERNSRPFASIKPLCLPGLRLSPWKFDVEGVEDSVLRRSARLSDVDAFVGEIHERVMGASTEEFEQLFEGCETSVEPLPNGEQLFRATRSSAR